MLLKDKERKDEIEYRTKFAMTNLYVSKSIPKYFFDDNYQFSMAPGEGKIPENILMSDNRDALSFPMKHPDGNNNLHQKRDIRLK